MLNEVRARLKLVAQKAREVAKELDGKSSYPFGRMMAFDDQGQPCCAWGHVMARAGFKPSGRYGINSAALWDFVCGEEGHYILNNEGPADTELRFHHDARIFNELVDVSRYNDTETAGDENRIALVKSALFRVAHAIEETSEKC